MESQEEPIDREETLLSVSDLGIVCNCSIGEEVCLWKTIKHWCMQSCSGCEMNEDSHTCLEEANVVLLDRYVKEEIYKLLVKNHPKYMWHKFEVQYDDILKNKIIYNELVNIIKKTRNEVTCDCLIDIKEECIWNAINDWNTAYPMLCKKCYGEENSVHQCTELSRKELETRANELWKKWEIREEVYVYFAKLHNNDSLYLWYKFMNKSLLLLINPVNLSLFTNILLAKDVEHNDDDIVFESDYSFQGDNYELVNTLAELAKEDDL